MFGRANTLFVSLVVAFLVGCDRQDVKPAASTGGVAVIDLDAVAAKLGRDLQMSNAAKQQADLLNEQLQQYQVTLRGQYDQKKNEFGAARLETQEKLQKQQAELQLIDRQLGTQLNQARAKAQQNLNASKLRLIQQFREEVKPVAQSVATELGLSTVVTKNDSVVFAYASAVDITDRVAERMRGGIASQPSAETAHRTSAGMEQR
ncbi:MAG: OmpH family outer membrane protein [Planctomycetes bacterium]|nr:OmpH family outer membrane protein [Planctomycetota bacterium]MBL7037611.1 OmpH family outer membrane protein [Pirellulaceae bacterium]